MSYIKNTLTVTAWDYLFNHYLNHLNIWIINIRRCPCRLYAHFSPPSFLIIYCWFYVVEKLKIFSNNDLFTDKFCLTAQDYVMIVFKYFKLRFELKMMFECALNGSSDNLKISSLLYMLKTFPQNCMFLFIYLFFISPFTFWIPQILVFI